MAESNQYPGRDPDLARIWDRVARAIAESIPDRGRDPDLARIWDRVARAIAESPQDRERDPDLARIWDRVGSAMGAAGELGDVIARRNLDLWNRVASNLSKATYTGDDLAADAARAVTTAMSNLRDAWTVVTFPPVGPVDPFALPSRSLFLQPDLSSPPPEDDRRSGYYKGKRWGYMVSEDVPPIPVPPPVLEANSIVAIRLAGPEEDTSKRLQEFLKAEYSSTDRSVTLVPQDVRRLTAERELHKGVYQGVVYVDADTTPRAIAHLSIVVEPKPEVIRRP
jgi:hypothetical protein